MSDRKHAKKRKHRSSSPFAEDQDSTNDLFSNSTSTSDRDSMDSSISNNKHPQISQVRLKSH